MKSIFKRTAMSMIAYAIISVIIFCSVMPVSAEINIYSQLPTNYQEQMEIRGYSNPISVIPLFDQNDNIVAYCFDFENSYMIINLNGVVLEHSPKINSPYYGISEKAYYGGYLLYYIKYDNSFLNLYTLETTERITFSSVVNSTNMDYVQSMSYINSLETLSDNYTGYTTSSISGQLKTLNYNDNNACGPLAVEILLLYFDQYVNDSFVTSYLSQNTKEFFYYLIQTYFPTYTTTNDQLVSGMNKYFSDAKLDYKASFISFAFDSLVRIDLSSRKWPLILRLYENSSSSSNWSIDHWVIISGIREYFYQGKKVTYEYKVNDGWGHNDVYILYSTDYMQGVVSLSS